MVLATPAYSAPRGPSQPARRAGSTSRTTATAAAVAVRRAPLLVIYGWTWAVPPPPVLDPPAGMLDAMTFSMASTRTLATPTIWL